MGKNGVFDSKQKLSEYYTETRIWSGGYQKHRHFKDLVDIGESLIPFLLRDLESDDYFWQSIWLLSKIAGESRPIIPNDCSGVAQKVKLIWLNWGKIRGLKDERCI